MPLEKSLALKGSPIPGSFGFLSSSCHCRLERTATTVTANLLSSVAEIEAHNQTGSTSHNGVMALHPSPGWSVYWKLVGCGNGPVLLMWSWLLWRMLWTTLICFSQAIWWPVVGWGETLKHWWRKWRKSISVASLRWNDTSGKESRHSSQGSWVFLIHVSGHKHFLRNIAVSTCFFSPGAISSTSNSFILTRKKSLLPCCFKPAEWEFW